MYKLKKEKSSYPIQILEVIGTADLAGTEKMFFSLVNGLDENLFSIKVCCLSKGPLIAKLKSVGADVTVIERKKLIDVFFLIKFYWFLTKGQFKLVHFHSWRLGAISAKLAKIPVILETRHGIGYIFKEMNVWKFFKYRLASQFSKKIIAVADSVKHDLINEVGIKPQRIIVIHNGINSSAITKEIKSNCLSLPENNGFLNIASIGRLDSVKGHQYFINSAVDVIQNFPNIKFWIIGDGPERKSLEMLSESSGLNESVIFTGWIDNVFEIITHMDILVFPSLREGLSIAVLEAMVLGKPIIATNIGGNPEIVKDDITGFLVPPRNTHKLSEKIIFLVKNLKEGKRLGEAGKNMVIHNFSELAMVKKTENLYCDLLKGIS